MRVIRVTAITFQQLLPLIKEQEEAGHFYEGHSDDGTIRPEAPLCCKVVYFNDGVRYVTFEDRTPK